MTHQIERSSEPVRSTVQVTPEHYDFDSYVNQDRWVSYFEQIRAVADTTDRSVLIVGAGDGIVPLVLERLGFDVHVVDIDATRSVDVIASVDHLPYTDRSFGVVMCCQVLEHLPAVKFASCANELARVARSRLVVSLPRHGRSWRLEIRLPRLLDLVRSGTLKPRRAFRPNAEHYWELDGGLTVQQVSGALNAAMDSTAEVWQNSRDLYRVYFRLERAELV